MPIVFGMSLVIVWLNYPQMCQLIEVNIIFNRDIFPQTIWPYVSIFRMHFFIGFTGFVLVVDRRIFIFEFFYLLHSSYKPSIESNNLSMVDQSWYMYQCVFIRGYEYWRNHFIYWDFLAIKLVVGYKTKGVVEVQKVVKVWYFSTT